MAEAFETRTSKNFINRLRTSKRIGNSSRKQNLKKPQKPQISQSLRGSTVTNYFKFSLAGTSTIVLYSFESPWASLCPCANTCCVRGVASARPRRASKRLDCRLWKRDLFHQHNRKGKIVMIETSRYKGLQRRPAHAKPDFNWLSGPRNGTWKRTCGISCLRSLAPMWRFAMQHHPGNIHQSFATPRYSATPCYVLVQVPNVIDTISKRWRSKKAFNTSLSHTFS